MKPILQSIKTGGTDAGIHYWLSWLKCPRRARLMEAAKFIGEEVKEDSPALSIGTIFHAFLERYYKTQNIKDNPSAIEFKNTNGEPCGFDEENRIEAERLFRAYRLQFKPTDLGSVVGVEKEFEYTGFPVPKLTGRLDLVTEVSRSDCNRLIKEFPLLNGLHPGTYIVDHKTDSFPDGYEAYRYDLQFPTYLIANQDNYKNLKGVIVNVVYKKKEVGFNRILIGMPTKDDRDMLENVLSFAAHMKNTSPDLAVPTYCVAKFGYKTYYCPFLNNGCRRY